MTRTKALILVIVMLFISNGYGIYRTLETAGGLRGQVQQNSTEIRRIDSEQRFIFESCQRLNILRVEDNISHYADYRVFKIVLEESRAVRRRFQTHQQAIFQQRFLNQLAQAVREKTWVPRTDCRRAVNRSGASFRPPRPVSFARQLPSRRSVTLLPGDFGAGSYP